ncbi:MAG: peptide ABC transporter substrate-binding protein [Pirellulaceae bacterium]|jgi:oligopeptide transport system substrate-binding protein|nr:peptide ABC transporter substrate-binding protein [Pirellulaceae bacterium]MDP7019844.1 peptide ABC transporter substrate-binding protein [Pirellulaceae bacterium]
MGQTSRKWFGIVAGIACVLAVIFSVWQENPAPADYTFSNGTEIKSVDPAIVTGQPEGQIIRGIYEGLVGWNPKDLRPEPTSAAESWTISDDGRTYHFKIRDNAKWSNGEPVTAQDFEYSFRRFLDPMTGAEYVFLLKDVKNAVEYNELEYEPGSRVEVELPEPAADALPFGRGETLHGVLKSIEDGQPPVETDPDETGEGEGDEEESEEDAAPTLPVYTVTIDGVDRRFCSKPDNVIADVKQGASIEQAKQVLLDFDHVGIVAVDRRTLRIELNNPVPYFINLLGFYPLFPVNKKCVETHGYPAWTKPQNIVTNGCFILHSRKVRDRIRMVRNPHYWDQENVHLDTVDALAVESQTTELNLYLAGKIDYFRQVPATIIPDLLKQNRSDFNPQPFLSVYFYKINTTKPGLTDRRVRQALSLAIDRREIVEHVTRAGQIPALRYVPPGIADYEAAKQRMNIKEVELPRQAAIAKAKKLLTEAGFPDGKGIPQLVITYNTNDLHAQIAELIQAQLKENLGINVQLKNKEWGTYLADQRKGDYMIGRNGWIGDYVDPNTFLDLFVTDGPQNNTNWSNARYDEIVFGSSAVKLADDERAAVEQQVKEADGWSEGRHAELLRAAVDLERQRKRMRLFVEAEDLLIEEAPIIPLYYYVTQGMVRPYVKGFYQNIQDVHPYKGMRIDEDEKRRVFEAEELR